MTRIRFTDKCIVETRIRVPAADRAPAPPQRLTGTLSIRA